MEIKTAAGALSALGHETRLRVFRLLMQYGSSGTPAGDIAAELEIAPNTLSAHLAVLSRAGLLYSRKEGRSVIYAIDLEGTQNLLAFLVEDCCRAERVAIIASWGRFSAKPCL